ncbi:MAG: thioesterase [Oceanospirillaceae bacterium]|nr:thioesterase [Oceanospirillaceae bacterium]|tara:strand:+ start:352 stop:840 length:489 start_codon:yes stop_codon:yes gene_type:complete
MARVKLQLPEAFTFSTDLDVRVSDVNYGNHLGNDRMVTLLHEARLRFLTHHDFAELNIGGVGMMVTDLVVTFNAESFMGDNLTFHVGLTDFTKYGCDMIYRVENKALGKKIAEAKTGIVFFDYDERKIARVPKVFYARCAPEMLEERDKATPDAEVEVAEEA